MQPHEYIVCIDQLHTFEDKQQDIEKVWDEYLDTDVIPDPSRMPTDFNEEILDWDTGYVDPKIFLPQGQELQLPFEQFLEPSEPRTGTDEHTSFPRFDYHTEEGNEVVFYNANQCLRNARKQNFTPFQKLGNLTERDLNILIGVPKYRQDGETRFPHAYAHRGRIVYTPTTTAKEVYYVRQNGVKFFHSDEFPDNMKRLWFYNEMVRRGYYIFTNDPTVLCYHFTLTMFGPHYLVLDYLLKKYDLKQSLVSSSNQFSLHFETSGKSRVAHIPQLVYA